MSGIWLSPALGDELVSGEAILERTDEVLADITAGVLDISTIVGNMSAALTHKDAECRARGMLFFTGILKAIPPDFLTEMQLKFITNFYTDRLKDNHRVIPAVLEGYKAAVKMRNFPIESVAEFFTVLFREVACQSQLRTDRANIYYTIQHLLESHHEYMSTLGPDFVYGVISAIDGERDPRNLLLLFTFLPNFMRCVSLGHLVEEMFDVVSCYFPIDFTAAPGDQDAIGRQNLADALAPCLSAVPEFGEPCLLLLIEKLDSSLRLAKIDSLQLLAESCKIFDVSVYTPFLKTLWASLQRELSHKTDEELKMSAHAALHAVVCKLSEFQNALDNTFENFVSGILISMQMALADATTTVIFNQTAKILLTCANASKASCLIIVKAMIPSTIAYHSLKLNSKVQIAAMDFLVKLYELGKHWQVLEEMAPQTEQIPHLCLTVVSGPTKEHQIAALKTTIGTIEALKEDLVLPFIEVLTHNIHHSKDDDLMQASVKCIHAVASKYPNEVMEYAVLNKFNLEGILQEQELLEKRLSVLTELASLEHFTESIINKMLGMMSGRTAHAVADAFNKSISDTSLFSEEKVEQIERDHNFVDSILTWLVEEVSSTASPQTLTYGYSLISVTVSRLTCAQQLHLIEKHTASILRRCEDHESYVLILEALCNSLRPNVFSTQFTGILELSLKCALYNDEEFVRLKACVLVAHLLNKVESKSNFDSMYSSAAKAAIAVENREEEHYYKRLIQLCGWVTKSLLLRGSDHFEKWLVKIVSSLSSDKWCAYGAEAINLIVTIDPSSLSPQCHCRVSLLYKQRLFETFLALTDNKMGESDSTKETFLRSWAYVLGVLPKNVLIIHIDKIMSLVVESLQWQNAVLLAVMLSVLCHLVQAKHERIIQSLQTILPRLCQLTTFSKSMDVRICSLDCLYWIAESYPTVALVPHRNQAIESLAPALDDRKRLVRVAAVRARTRWILVGAPGEPEH